MFRFRFLDCLVTIGLPDFALLFIIMFGSVVRRLSWRFCDLCVVCAYCWLLIIVLELVFSYWLLCCVLL